MRGTKNGYVLAVKEHILEGKPITRLEAITLFGVPDLPKVINDMRKEGWTIKLRQRPYAAALKRINDFAVFKPPENLPIREIQLTEYWLSR
jgi:hypothetical protein